MTSISEEIRQRWIEAVRDRSSGTWVVVVCGTGTVFGPFDHTQACRFAQFLTDEVDPAEVRPLCSPVTELLGWRQAIALPAMHSRLASETDR